MTDDYSLSNAMAEILYLQDLLIDVLNQYEDLQETLEVAILNSMDKDNVITTLSNRVNQLEKEILKYEQELAECEEHICWVENENDMLENEIREMY